MIEEMDDYLIYSAETHGDSESARKLIHKAGIALKNGEDMSLELRAFISKGLLRIADGETPNKALFLNKRKGRPQGDNSLKIFATIEFLVDALSWKKEAAFNYASNLHHIDRETIVKHYYKEREMQLSFFSKFEGIMPNGAELKFQMMYVYSGLPKSDFEEYLKIVNK